MSEAADGESFSLVPAGERSLVAAPGGLASRGLDLAATLLAQPAVPPPPGEIRCLRGHGDCVLSVAFSPDDRFAVSGSWDGSVRLWELATGRETQRLEGHTHRVSCVAFSADGRQVISGSWDGTARIWDWETGRETGRFGQAGGEMVHCVTFSPDGRYAACGGTGRTFVLWDVNTGAEARSFQVPVGPVRALRFSPDGKTLLSGSGQVAVLGKGRDNGSLLVWDVASGKLLWGRVDAKEPVLSVAFSPDGRSAFASTGWPARDRLNVTTIWDVGSGREVSRHAAHRQPVFSGGFIPGCPFLLLGGRDRLLRVWDASEQRELHRFPGHTDAIFSVAISSDGLHALTASADRTVRYWRLPPAAA